MESAVIIPLTTLVVLGAALTVDLTIETCLRFARRGFQRSRAARRVIAGAIITVLVSTLRPGTGAAAVPPPSVRITSVEPSTQAADAGTRGRDASPSLVATYTVERGDCLWRIAKRLIVRRYGTSVGSEVSSLWRSIYEANRDVIGDDPDLILPGQTLALPGGW